MMFTVTAASSAGWLSSHSVINRSISKRINNRSSHAYDAWRTYLALHSELLVEQFLVLVIKTDFLLEFPEIGLLLLVVVMLFLIGPDSLPNLSKSEEMTIVL